MTAPLAGGLQPPPPRRLLAHALRPGRVAVFAFFCAPLAAGIMVSDGAMILGGAMGAALALVWLLAPCWPARP